MKTPCHLDMTAGSSGSGRRRLIFSLALISLPPAFQFADAAIVPVPDAMRLVLAISVWATLVVLELACGALVWAVWQGVSRVRGASRHTWRLHSR